MTDKTPKPTFANLFGTGGTPVEPNPAFRRMANNLFEMYSSFVQAGFDADQALDIVLEIIRFNSGRGKDE